MATFNTGAINQRMRVTGVGLYALSGLEIPGAGFVDFNYFDSNPESIEFVVPESVTYGNINFYFITGASASIATYKSGISFFPVPRVDSVYPKSQDVNNLVVVSGKGLSGISTVFFNNISGTSVNYDSNSGGLVVRVPSGYTSGPIRVSGFNGTGIVNITSNVSYYGKISLTGFSSPTAYEGDILKISGQNFFNTFVNSVNFPVTFNGPQLGSYVTGIFTGSANLISGQVPPGATSGFVSINSPVDNNKFLSTTPVYILRQPSVTRALKYYYTSGDSNIILGKNFQYVTGVTLSGYSYRQAKPIVNNGVLSSPSGRFGKSLLISSGSYFKVPGIYGSDFSFGTNDFTIEFWAYPFSYGTPRIDIFSNDPMSSPRQSGFAFTKSQGGANWDFTVSGGAIISTSTANLPPLQWSKVCVSRRGTSTYLIITGNAIPSSTSVTSNYTIRSTGDLYVGLGGSGSINVYTGFIDDFRILANTGLYSNTTLPQASFPSFDDNPNIELLVHGNYSDLDFSGFRNLQDTISIKSGWIRDYNYGPNLNTYSYSSFSTNAPGSAITFTGSGITPGVYNLILSNTGNRQFTTNNFLVNVAPPVILEMSVTEGYMGQPVEIYGQNLYPQSQIFFQDTGVSGNYVESSEDQSSYYVSSTYRTPKNITSAGVFLSQTGSKFDDRSLVFSGAQTPYIYIPLTTGTLSYKNSFTLEADFLQSPGFLSSHNKYIFSSENLGVHCNSGYLTVSGFKFLDKSTATVSGYLGNGTGWHHISISKTYNINGTTGDILLDGSGLFSFSSDFSIATGDLLVGSLTGGMSTPSSWSGFIDDIRISTISRYDNSKVAPIKRFKNDSSTEALVHASFGIQDDTINDFEYLKTYIPNLAAYRRTYISANNGYGSYTGGSNQVFTFLTAPQITGILTPTGNQGLSWTGLGTDLYYVDNIYIGDYQVTGYSIYNSGSEFNQAIVLTIPDFSQNGDELNITSNYYNYTFPSGLVINSGILKIDGFSPTSVSAGDTLSISGKFLNKINTVRLGSQFGGYYDVKNFSSQTINGITLQIPYAYNFADGPITLFGTDGSITTSTQSLTYINPSILAIKPISAYWTDQIIFSGTNLSGLDFAVTGAKGDVVKFTGVTYVGNTGVYLRVPREIVKSTISFFYSGTNSGLAGNSRVFEASPIITGVNTTGYRSRDPIVVTGINLYKNTAKDLYISGYNWITNTTGQFILATDFVLFDARSVTGTNISQPYTGFVSYSGRIGVNTRGQFIPYYNILTSGTQAGIGTSTVGIGTSAYNTYSKIIDGFVGSGNIFFQRNSFDADNLYQMISVRAPLIGISGINYTTGNIGNLLTISGSNLNYVTGIRFQGVSRLAVAISGSSPAHFAVNYRTGVTGYIDATTPNSLLYYKDSYSLQFYPPPMSGKGVHYKDVEDVRPITGNFYLMTYFGEEYRAPFVFNYEPYISINDTFLNNGLTYISDGTTKVSGFDGSVISFSGQGVKNLTNVEFFSSNSGIVIEKYPTDFHLIKRAPRVVFYNSPGAIITGYSILDPGAGYDTSSPSFNGDISVGVGVTAINGNGIVSFIPPYVGMVTGINISFFGSGILANAWSGSNITWTTGAKFITQAPNKMRFTGNNWVTQSGDGQYWAAYYTTSTTFPTGNDFTVGEQLDFKLYNKTSIYTTMGKPFLTIQDPYNIHKVGDFNLTGNYVGQKNRVPFNFSDVFGAGFAFRNEPSLKTSLIYPTGWARPLLTYQLDNNSIAQTGFYLNFSTAIPATGTYAIVATDPSTRYLRLRVEASDPLSSFYKGLGSAQLQTIQIIGAAGIGTSVGYGTGPVP